MWTAVWCLSFSDISRSFDTVLMWSQIWRPNCDVCFSVTFPDLLVLCWCYVRYVGCTMMSVFQWHFQIYWCCVDVITDMWTCDHRFVDIRSQVCRMHYDVCVSVTFPTGTWRKRWRTTVRPMKTWTPGRWWTMWYRNTLWITKMVRQLSAALAFDLFVFVSLSLVLTNTFGFFWGVTGGGMFVE